MKKYSYPKIRKEVERIVKTACEKRDNKFGSSLWRYHVQAVLKHSLVLGKKLKADKEVLELAAMLHDYAAIKDYKLYKDHHIHGAQYAEEILRKLNFPEEKIKQVKECIFSHRGSVKKKRKTREAKILASADAMAHITELPDMFYLAYGVHRLKTCEGSKFLKNKLQRSWRKTMPEGKKIVKEDYEAAIKILNRALEK